MDEKLAQLATDLEQTAGPNLLSVVLYGSAASGEFHTQHSDLNLLCLFERLDAETLKRINPLTRRWARKGHAPPLVFEASRLAEAADLFAIELMDIKASHKVLYGSDLVATIEVPMTLHHLQVERELRQNLVRLRQHYLASDGGRKALLGLMTASISSFAVLFRHAAIALGAPSSELAQPLRKRAAVDRLAAVIGFEARPFHTIFDIREKKIAMREADPENLFRDYLEAITQVVHEVDRRLEERSRG
jgi:predicted nucleotidyltransferase